MLNHNSIHLAFDKAAHHYDQHALVQHWSGLYLIDKLKKFNNKFSQIIDLGCGTGLITRELLLSVQYNAADALDTSPRALKITQERLHHFNCHFIKANFDNYKYSKSYNLVFSNLALHWSTNLLKCMQNIATYQASGDWIALTLPLPGTLAELKNKFAVHSFYDHDALLLSMQENYSIKLAEVMKKTLTYTDTKSALYSIKNIGASKGSLKRKYLGKKIFQYNITNLSYVLGFYIAQKL